MPPKHDDHEADGNVHQADGNVVAPVNADILTMLATAGIAPDTLPTTAATRMVAELIGTVAAPEAKGELALILQGGGGWEVRLATKTAVKEAISKLETGERALLDAFVDLSPAAAAPDLSCTGVRAFALPAIRKLLFSVLAVVCAAWMEADAREQGMEVSAGTIVKVARDPQSYARARLLRTMVGPHHDNTSTTIDDGAGPSESKRRRKERSQQERQKQQQHERKCHACGKPGHKWFQCPEKEKAADYAKANGLTIRR